MLYTRVRLILDYLRAVQSGKIDIVAKCILVEYR